VSLRSAAFLVEVLEHKEIELAARELLPSVFLSLHASAVAAASVRGGIGLAATYDRLRSSSMFE
jgi:hypothetical protein